MQIVVGGKDLYGIAVIGFGYPEKLFAGAMMWGESRVFEKFMRTAKFQGDGDYHREEKIYRRSQQPGASSFSQPE